MRGVIEVGTGWCGQEPYGEWEVPSAVRMVRAG